MNDFLDKLKEKKGDTREDPFKKFLAGVKPAPAMPTRTATLVENSETVVSPFLDGQATTTTNKKRPIPRKKTLAGHPTKKPVTQADADALFGESTSVPVTTFPPQENTIETKIVPQVTLRYQPDFSSAPPIESEIMDVVKRMEIAIKGIYDLLEARLLPLLESLQAPPEATVPFSNMSLEAQILAILSEAGSKLMLKNIFTTLQQFNMEVSQDEVFEALKTLHTGGKIATDSVHIWKV